jgi:hypothetical protein
MLLTKEVEITLTGKMIKYYNDLGYEGGHHDKIMVKIEDLSPGSKAKVDVLCDYCKKNVISITYKGYNKLRGDKCACPDCLNMKKQELCMEKYGVKSTLQLPSIREEIKKTNLAKYGAEVPSKNAIVQQKIINTCLEKYGVTNPFQSEYVKDKIRKSMVEKYGEENPMQVKEIKDKAEKTNLQRYGTKAPAQSEEVKNKLINTMNERYGGNGASCNEEVKKKIVKSLCDNKNMACSSQQKYLHNLYGGKLNYPYEYYALDIYLPEYNIDVEYNGSGHDLIVKLDRMSQSEFDQKEIIRSNIIKRKGFKRMTIISSKDKLPSDEILLQMLDKAINYFNSTTHSWIEFNIDNSTYQNAQDGIIHYDYGELRTIKKTDIPDESNNITDISDIFESYN